jgi:2,4-dienoyl-CoA reductase-like NADH-dependent reductase (Old Yellow Enzyme family)
MRDSGDKVNGGGKLNIVAVGRALLMGPDWILKASVGELS